MYTQCPNCRQAQPLTVAQLRTGRAIAYCNHCSIHYDALELLTETAPEQSPGIEPPITPAWLPTEPPQLLPWEEPEPATNNRYWRIGVLVSFIALIGQGVYFEGHAATQNNKLRPTLAKLCRILHCRLPIYQNADELTVLQSSFTDLPNRHYAFKTVIVNQAAFTQPCPKIKLTLLNFSGRPFTYRVFGPQDYLTNPATAVLSPDAALDATLNIAATKTLIGGYHFELSY